MSRRKLFKKMLRKALIKDGIVLPCGSHKTVDETFCIEGGCAVLQYTKDETTKSGGCIISPLTKEAYEEVKDALKE
jgi:hypothetical protein